MKLKEHLSQEQGLSDLLNYAHLVDDGIIVNKDGAFLMSYKFRGPDTNSSTTGELDALTETFNRMATFLEDGWMLHVDEIRVPSVRYPDAGHFPDAISAMIDQERRERYEDEGAHYENFQIMTFVWKFPIPTVKTARHWFIEGLDKNEGQQNLTNLLEFFKDNVERLTGLLSYHMILERLTSEDLLSFLNTCITGELLPVAVPKDGGYIDVALGRAEIIGGYYPKVGKKFVRILTLHQYDKDFTHPGQLERLCTYSMVYRYSNRFVPLSEPTAAKEIKRYRKDWNNKVKGLMGMVKETFTGKESTKLDQDALNMSQQTVQALTENSSRAERFGFWSSQIIFMHEDQELMTAAIKEIKDFLEKEGFSCLEETVNAMDAWLGCVPGHGSSNLRRMFASSKSLGHLLPLSSIWAGALVCSPASKLPPNSPPLFYAATLGKTPFRFHLDVSDVGHGFIGGPTGSGKTTLLDFQIMQFFRYEGAKVYIFDKDRSHEGLATALGVDIYDVGNATQLSFCPLSNLSTEQRKISAKLYVERLVELQGISLTPNIRTEIHKAIESLSDKGHEENRSLTVLRSTVQNQQVRDALEYYTLEGPMKMMDASKDAMDLDGVKIFEMGWLLDQRQEVFLPVLMHLFDQITQQLEEDNAKYPVMIVLEEAWKYIGHPYFSAKLVDWLKTLRKFNARVIFATQSLSDLYDQKEKTLTNVTAVILESCPTKIFLPNPAMEGDMKELYTKIGMNDRQIEIIRTSIPKKDYYVMTPEGRRLIDLGFNQNSLALVFLGISKERAKDMVKMSKEHPEDWIYHWLKDCKLDKWAEYWLQNYGHAENPENAENEKNTNTKKNNEDENSRVEV